MPPMVVEIVRALMAPEVAHHLTPQFRNGVVMVEVRMVNGRVAYVQPVIKPEMKVGVDFGRKVS